MFARRLRKANETQLNQSIFNLVYCVFKFQKSFANYNN